MENKQVLTETELNSLRRIQNDYLTILTELGNKDIQIFNLNSEVSRLYDEKDKLLDNYKLIKQEEDKLGKLLSDKYGNGRIDPISGEFIPE